MLFFFLIECFDVGLACYITRAPSRRLQCFQLSPSIFLFPYVRKVFDLPKFTDTLVSYLPGSGLGQCQLKVTGYSLLINIHEEILTTILKHTEHAKL